MVKNKTKFRIRGTDLLFDVLNHGILVIAALVVVYPLYFVVIASVSDPQKVLLGEVLIFPKDISFIGYMRILQNRQIWKAYFNTLVYTVAGTSLNIIVTTMAGYALSRNFSGKKFVNLFFVFTMFFSGGIIPTFLVVRNLGLYNNPLVMVIMGAISIWNLMITRTFLVNTLPQELYEAAAIDGCSHFRYYWMIVMPLSHALIGILCVYYAVGHWNDFMTGIIYLRNYDYMPLQVILRGILASLSIDYTSTTLFDEIGDFIERTRIAEVIKYCAIIISTLPIIILYLVLQKYFVQGVMIGSIKG